MEELVIEFGNDTLGEARIYPKNLKGYEQAVKDLKLYKAQQKAEIEDLKAQRHIYLNRSVEECNKITDLEFELQHKDEEITELKQQLAEKEEQLNSAQVGEEFALKCCDEANKLLALQVAGQHQDKISFAVAELEKVKEFCEGIGLNMVYVTGENPANIHMIIGNIDNQIKQLKEKK